MLLNILNHFTCRRIICSLSPAATSRAQPSYSHLNYYDGSSTFVRVLVGEQTNQTAQGRQRRETEMEKLREEDRKAGFKERMKITQLLIIKKATRAEHFTCSTKILAWSAHPSKRTWLATSSTFQRMIFWRSFDTAAWLLWLMEVLSSLRNADGNPLPSGHGNEKGETCWMPLSSTRKEQYERKNEALYYYELRRLFIIHWFTKGTYHLHKKNPEIPVEK